MPCVALGNEGRVGDLVKPKKLNCIIIQFIKFINLKQNNKQLRRGKDLFKGTPEEGKVQWMDKQIRNKMKG